MPVHEPKLDRPRIGCNNSAPTSPYSAYPPFTFSCALLEVSWAGPLSLLLPVLQPQVPLPLPLPLLPPLLPPPLLLPPWPGPLPQPCLSPDRQLRPVCPVSRLHLCRPGWTDRGEGGPSRRRACSAARRCPPAGVVHPQECQLSIPCRIHEEVWITNRSAVLCTSQT